MKHYILLFACAILFSTCQKDTAPSDPRDATRIEGRWRSLLPAHPDWQYDFNDGLLTQSVTDLGVVVSSLQFTYAIRHDTIHIGGDGINIPRNYQAYIHCDSIAELKNITPGAIIAPTMWLHKTQ